MLKVLILTIVSFSIGAAAQEPVIQTYNFQAWKEQQILEAQNQVLRISARISQLKTSKPGTAGGKDLSIGSSRLKKVETDPLVAAEKDLRRTQESLQAASNRTMDEYINIYLLSLSNEPDTVQALVQRLSKEELGEILKGLLIKNPPSDAKRNTAQMADALSLSSRSKSP
jgi:hypothetical protein